LRTLKFVNVMIAYYDPEQQFQLYLLC